MCACINPGLVMCRVLVIVIVAGVGVPAPGVPSFTSVSINVGSSPCSEYSRLTEENALDWGRKSTPPLIVSRVRTMFTVTEKPFTGVLGSRELELLDLISGTIGKILLLFSSVFALPLKEQPDVTV